MGCTAAHLRSHSLNIVLLSDMIEGSYRSWDSYTTGQLVDCLQQKKENRFSLNGNGIMSFFLGRQFYRSTLYIKKNYIIFCIASVLIAMILYFALNCVYNISLLIQYICFFFREMININRFSYF